MRSLSLVLLFSVLAQESLASPPESSLDGIQGKYGSKEIAKEVRESLKIDKKENHVILTAAQKELRKAKQEKIDKEKSERTAKLNEVKEEKMEKAKEIKSKLDKVKTEKAAKKQKVTEKAAAAKKKVEEEKAEKKKEVKESKAEAIAKTKESKAAAKAETKEAKEAKDAKAKEAKAAKEAEKKEAKEESAKAEADRKKKRASVESAHKAEVADRKAAKKTNEADRKEARSKKAAAAKKTKEEKKEKEAVISPPDHQGKAGLSPTSPDFEYMSKKELKAYNMGQTKVPNPAAVQPFNAIQILGGIAGLAVFGSIILAAFKYAKQPRSYSGLGLRELAEVGDTELETGYEREALYPRSMQVENVPE